LVPVSEGSGAALRSPYFPIIDSSDFLKKNVNFGWFFLEIRWSGSLDSPSLARSCDVIDGSIGQQSRSHLEGQCNRNGFR
jgi:hypothetical protein